MTLAARARDAAGEIAANGRDWGWWQDRLTEHVNGRVQPRLTSQAGIDVMAEDWDVLVVLDACRSDLFEATVQPHQPGRISDYRRVTSKGSMTREWVERNFQDRTFPDSVYVTGNPLVARHAPDAWHHRRDVWQDGFDPSVGTVRPETVTDAALDAAHAYPRKRLIVHYLQPHCPFLDAPDLWYSSFDIDGWDGSGADPRARSVWDALRRGLVDEDRVLAAYRRNLEAAMPEVERLLDGLDGGRVVVTSDHGNVAGRRSWPLPVRVFGHPPGLRHPGLVRVPWAVISRGERWTIETGDATSSGAAVPEEQLAALGYR